MTRALPPHVARVAQLVVELAGGYLHNTIREPGVTCAVCSAPVTAGERLCGPCQGHETSGVPHADRVASLVYTVEYDTQAYKLVRNYKADSRGPSMRDMMNSLLALGLQGHADCEAALARGGGEAGWAVVPSTRHHDRPQPLRQLLVERAKPGREVALAPVGDLTEPRELDPGHFAVTSPPPYPPHVVLVDDSWVRGGHAQSAAAALKLVGVEDVSIFTVARVLDPAWGPNPRFIAQRLIAPFDPATCPWTGGACP